MLSMLHGSLVKQVTFEAGPGFVEVDRVHETGGSPLLLDALIAAPSYQLCHFPPNVVPHVVPPKAAHVASSEVIVPILTPRHKPFEELTSST
jgi:hypothetical protein